MSYIKKSLSRRIFEVFNTLILILLGLCFVLPMWHVICCSFSDPVELNVHSGITIWPLGKMTLEGYKIILSNKTVWRAYGNTLFYVTVGTLISMMFTIIGGYCLSRKGFKIRNALMMFISFTMLFDGGLMPNYLVISNLGMLGTRWAVLIPNCISVMNLIIMRTSFQEIPEALEEAARIDGASDIQIMFKVILPLSKATTSVITLFYAVWRWNSWFHPNIYLNGNRKLFPLQLVLKEILLSNSVSEVGDGLNSLSNILVQYVIIVVATLPILCIYPFVQKYFTEGVMIGAVKG